MRIASLLSSATEMLFGLGLGSQVLAVSHECDFPAEVERLPRATRSRVDSSQSSGAIDVQVKSLLAAGEPLYEVDRELLARLSPELIVTQAQCDVCAVRYQDVLDAVAAEPRLAGTRVIALNPMSIGDVLADIERLGAATERREAAVEYVASLKTRLRAVEARVGRVPIEQRPRVACIEWIEPLMLAGNWMPELIELAGGRSLLTEPGRHSPYVRWEDLRAADPDAILVAPCGFDLARTRIEALALEKLPGWQNLSAVREGRVHLLDGNAYFNRSGPRLVESVEMVAEILGPAGMTKFQAPNPSKDQ
jgi:iron complex transport system substrate-binding protein